MRKNRSRCLSIGQRPGHDLIFYSKKHRHHPIGIEEPLNSFKQNYILIIFVPYCLATNMEDGLGRARLVKRPLL